MFSSKLIKSPIAFWRHFHETSLRSLRTFFATAQFDNQYKSWWVKIDVGITLFFLLTRRKCIMICIFLSHCKSALRSQKSDSSDPVRDPLFLRHQSPLSIYMTKKVHIKEVRARPRKIEHISITGCAVRESESASNSVHCSLRRH
jgi:hypothetical protein